MKGETRYGLGTFVVVAVIILVVWFQHATGIPQHVLDWVRAYWASHETPEQCFQAISKAQEDYDLTMFRKYVDLDEVAAQAFESFKENLDGLNQVRVWGDELIDRRAANLMKSILVEAIETGDARQKWILTLPLPEDLKKTKHDLGKLRVEDPSGKVCSARLPLDFPDLGRSVWLRYRLRDVGTHWQIASIDCKGFYRDIEEVKKELIKRQNAAIEEKNKSTTSQIRKVLHIAHVASQKVHRYLGFNSMVFTFQTENTGDREIVQYGGNLECKKKDGKEVEQIPFVVSSRIAPGAKSNDLFEAKVGLFDSRMNKAYDLSDTDLLIEANIETVKFANGKELAIQARVKGNPDK
jgi:hypothetical protein